MHIGIIGAGHIGGTLTRRLTTIGHHVATANSRGPETLRDLAAETGAEAVTIEEALTDKDIVIIAIPERSVPSLPRERIDAAPPDTVFVDTGNYYPQRDGYIEAIEGGMPESVWMSKQISRPVIKVFNNIYAQHLMERGRPAGADGRIALPVAGNDPTAKTRVIQLLDQLGFDAVDAGNLDESWRQQPGTPVYGTDLDVAGVRTALAQASRERPAEFKAKR
jgi:8-hydroxy-5-deazaflavin:NADPH oxidoreductase